MLPVHWAGLRKRSHLCRICKGLQFPDPPPLLPLLPPNQEDTEFFRYADTAHPAGWELGGLSLWDFVYLYTHLAGQSFLLKLVGGVGLSRDPEGDSQHWKQPVTLS